MRCITHAVYAHIIILEYVVRTAQNGYVPRIYIVQRHYTTATAIYICITAAAKIIIVYHCAPELI